MDDYELQNAREWDDGIDDGAVLPDQSQFQWTAVHASKKKGKKTKRYTPAPPPLRQRVPATAPSPLSSRIPQGNCVRTESAQKQDQNLPINPAATQIQQREMTNGSSGQGGTAKSPHGLWFTAKWTTSRRGLAPRRAAPRLPRLFVEEDDEAQRSWRERKPQAAEINIPASMIHADRHTYDVPTHLRIAQEHHTYVYSEDIGSNSTVLRFGIWGEPQNARAAKLDLQNWISVAAPDSRQPSSSKFPKVVSLTPVLRNRMEKRWIRDVERNQFRRFPPSDMAFGAIGGFYWPMDEHRPDECFGSSYQALDEIRMDLSCYITFDAEQSLFQAFGKFKHVQAALQRIRHAFFQAVSKTTNPARAYLLRWSSSESIPSHIFLQDYSTRRLIEPVQTKSSDVCFSPVGEGVEEDGSTVEMAKARSDLNVERIRVTIGNGLKKLHYYNGHLAMRLRLGRFIPTQYERSDDGIYKLQKYEEMSDQSQFNGLVTEELGDRAIEQDLLAIVRSAGDLFIPQDAMTEDLCDIRPVYCVMFLFDDNDRDDLRLTMNWIDPGGDIEFAQPTKIEWARLERDADLSKLLLDMSLTDLTAGTSLQFEISAAKSEDPSHLPEKFKRFPDRVKIDKDAALRNSPTKPFVVYNPYLNPKRVRQSLLYQYAIKGTDYTLELAQLQDRELEYKQLFRRPDVKVYEQRWSVNIYRIEWDTWLAKNARLPVGLAAEWDDDLKSWFPDNELGEKDDDEAKRGFAQLLEKVGEVERRIRAGSEGEDNHGSGRNADEQT